MILQSVSENKQMIQQFVQEKELVKALMVVFVYLEFLEKNVNG